MQPTRRTVVAAGALGLVSACRRSKGPAAPDPDVALRTAALSREQQLLAAYESVMRVRPALGPVLRPLAGEKAEHIEALGPATPTTSTVATVAALLALERAAASAHGQAAVRASRALAPLLASLSASSACAAALL